jgi:hypothetical protein
VLFEICERANGRRPTCLPALNFLLWHRGVLPRSGDVDATRDGLAPLHA